jgi:hypothetical protein
VGLLDRLWKAIGEVEFRDPDPVCRGRRGHENTRTSYRAGCMAFRQDVAALTGGPRAAVGDFEACTQTAAFYDVPREVPLLRFGEADYNSAQDIA